MEPHSTDNHTSHLLINIIHITSSHCVLFIIWTFIFANQIDLGVFTVTTAARMNEHLPRSHLTRMVSGPLTMTLPASRHFGVTCNVDAPLCTWSSIWIIFATLMS